MQLSAAKTGWLEHNWTKAEVEYTRIEGTSGRQTIKTGVVLDAVQRSAWCFDQIRRLLILAEEGQLKSSDTIYLDDFWTPGIEALAYTFHQLGITPKIYAYCWAQSVDEFDFTHSMKYWMRGIERSYGKILSGIFVANTGLRDLLVEADIAPKQCVHVVGLPFDSQEVLSRMVEPKRKELGRPFIQTHNPHRRDQVIFTSRFDNEKCPHFFMNVVDEFMRSGKSDIEFVVATGASELRSNAPGAVSRARATKIMYPKNFFIKGGLTKEQYYQELRNSKIQFNCADQDWVSFTLLEAVVAGCLPVYPNFRSFTETLDLAHESRYLYQKDSVDSAVKKIKETLAQGALWEADETHARKWIYERMDDTWLRMLKIMDVRPGATRYRTIMNHVAPAYPYTRHSLYEKLTPLC